MGAEDYDLLARDLHLVIQSGMDMIAIGILIRALCDAVELVVEDFDRERFISMALRGEDRQPPEATHYEHSSFHPDCPECVDMMERRNRIVERRENVSVIDFNGDEVDDEG